MRVSNFRSSKQNTWILHRSKPHEVRVQEGAEPQNYKLVTFLKKRSAGLTDGNRWKEKEHEPEVIKSWLCALWS